MVKIYQRQRKEGLIKKRLNDLLGEEDGGLFRSGRDYPGPLLKVLWVPVQKVLAILQE
jgi:hypothetical protein